MVKILVVITLSFQIICTVALASANEAYGLIDLYYREIEGDDQQIEMDTYQETDDLIDEKEEAAIDEDDVLEDSELKEEDESTTEADDNQEDSDLEDEQDYDFKEGEVDDDGLVSGCVIEQPRIQQTLIDNMYELIENNTVENPLVIPYGSTVNDVLNAIGWGDEITVLTSLSELNESEGVYGSIILQHKDYTPGIVCHSYLFIVNAFYVQFEAEDVIVEPKPTLPQTTVPTTPSTTAPSTQNLPQTGSADLNTMFLGLGSLAAGGLVTYRKMRKD